MAEGTDGDYVRLTSNGRIELMMKPQAEEMPDEHRQTDTQSHAELQSQSDLTGYVMNCSYCWEITTESNDA